MLGAWIGPVLFRHAPEFELKIDPPELSGIPVLPQQPDLTWLTARPCWWKTCDYDLLFRNRGIEISQFFHTIKLRGDFLGVCDQQ